MPAQHALIHQSTLEKNYLAWLAKDRDDGDGDSDSSVGVGELLPHPLLSQTQQFSGQGNQSQNPQEYSAETNEEQRSEVTEEHKLTHSPKHTNEHILTQRNTNTPTLQR